MPSYHDSANDCVSPQTAVTSHCQAQRGNSCNGYQQSKHTNIRMYECKALCLPPFRQCTPWLPHSHYTPTQTKSKALSV